MSQSTKLRWSNAVRAAAGPGILLGLFVLFIFLWKLFHLPEPEAMYASMVRWYQEFGLLMVAVAAFLEGIVLFNLYFPGSAVVLLGVAASRGDPSRAAEVVIVATFAFIMAAQVNFAVGYFGMHGILHRFGGDRWLQRAQTRYNRWGSYVIPISSFHPNIAGFAAVACGIAHFRWVTFFVLSATSTLVWDCLWGVLAYKLAATVEKVATEPTLALAGLTLWFCVSKAVKLIPVAPVLALEFDLVVLKHLFKAQSLFQ